jgi:hypothetical protein
LFHLFILVFNINYYPVPVYLHHFGEDVTYCRRSVCNGIRTCFYGFQYAFGGGTSGCDNGEVGMSFPDLPYYSLSIGSSRYVENGSPGLNSRFEVFFFPNSWAGLKRYRP